MFPLVGDPLVARISDSRRFNARLAPHLDSASLLVNKSGLPMKDLVSGSRAMQRQDVRSLNDRHHRSSFSVSTELRACSVSYLLLRFVLVACLLTRFASETNRLCVNAFNPDM